MSIRAIIIDDEMSSIDTLSIELTRHCPKVEILRSFISPIKALKIIPDLDFDLLFLDIEMPWINGFEVLKNLGKISFGVIFVTAYDQYAIQAIKVSAIDYLLKPIQSDDLIDAVGRFEVRRSFQNQSIEIDNLIHNLSTKQVGERKLLLATSEGIEFVTIKDIIHCKSESNYTNLVTTNGQVFLAKTLKEIEEMLSGSDFFRVHASHLINVNYIKRYIKSEGIILMSNGDQVSISRLRKDDFLTFISRQQTR